MSNINPAPREWQLWEFTDHRSFCFAICTEIKNEWDTLKKGEGRCLEKYEDGKEHWLIRSR